MRTVQLSCICSGFVFISLLTPFHWQTRYDATKQIPITGSYNHSLSFDPISGDLLNYYKFTNLASRAIYDNEFATASTLYDSAFVYKKNPFYVDLANYILVNHKSGWYEKNDAAIHQLITVKKIDTAQLFVKLPKRVFSENNLSSINAFVTKVNKTKLRETPYQLALREMFAEDQAARDFENAEKIDHSFYDRIDGVVEANFTRFEKLLATYGFPVEETVGVFFDAEHEWASIINTLLRNFISTKNKGRTSRVSEIIQQALFKGELHPSLGATLLDVIHGNPAVSRETFLNTTIYMVLGEPFRPFIFYSDSLMQKVNANRVNLGLDSFHITQKQVACQFFGAQTLGDTNVITMVQYAQLEELPSGWVRQAAKEANVNLSDYKINMAKILDKCGCQEKTY